MKGPKHKGRKSRNKRFTHLTTQENALYVVRYLVQIPRYVVDSIQAINGQNAVKIIGLTLCVFSELRTLKPMILSAFWPFIAWMESTTYLGNVPSATAHGNILQWWAA